MISDITAIIVSFNPDINILKKSITVLDESVHSIIIVDNGSDKQLVAEIRALLEKSENSHCILHPNPINYGVSHALNQGIELAEQYNTTHLLLLDHDSICDRQMISTLSTVSKELSSRSNIAAVGPLIIDRNSGKHLGITKIQNGFYKNVIEHSQQNAISVDHLITSGTLVLKDAIKEIGPFDSTLFIDHIDTDWCFKAKAKGFQLYVIPEATLNHSLGDYCRKIWLGKFFHVKLHSPLRHYYKIRNSVLLFRKDYIPLSFKLAEIIRALEKIVLYPILVRKNKLKHLKLMLTGLFHGLLGKNGKLN